VRGNALLRVSDAGGALRIDDLRCAPSLAMRRAGDDVYLVGTAASPIGGDEVALSLELAPGASLRVRSVAAAIARRGAGRRPARLTICARLGERAQLWWEPEPGVASAGSTMVVRTEISLAAGARVWWREEVVLGRFGEPPGRWISALHAERAGRPLLHHEVAVDAESGPALAGPGHRAMGSVLAVGGVPEPAVAHAEDGVAVVLPLECDDAVLISASARDHPALRRLLDAVGGAAEAPGSAPATGR